MKRKRIAFDLDDTLLESMHDFPTELAKRKWIFRLFKSESLRLGTTELMAFCRQQQWEIWIYTSSLRSKSYIKRIFRNYGITLDGIINQETHNKTVDKAVSKYPPAFGIDVLIDDSEGVKIEGERHHFNVIWLKTDDLNWVETIKARLIDFSIGSVDPASSAGQAAPKS